MTTLRMRFTTLATLGYNDPDDDNCIVRCNTILQEGVQFDATVSDYPLDENKAILLLTNGKEIRGIDKNTFEVLA